MKNKQNFIIRPYQQTDRHAVRELAGEDEFARPELVKRHPRMKRYLADGLAHYYDLEPESVFVAEVDGEVIGNLLGAVDTKMASAREKQVVRPLQRNRCLRGQYGFPVWLLPIWRTDRAAPIDKPPVVDLRQYPAHLHMGVKQAWRRKGVGAALMEAYIDYLRDRQIPGFHLYASSYHHQGVSFYRKVGLEELGQFRWHFHDGRHWLTATEHIFVKRLDGEF